MKVWMLADDPESAIDGVPYESESDAKKTAEHRLREYLASDGITDVTFAWREEPIPWEGLFVLHANGKRYPVTIWETPVFTFETATKEVSDDGTT